MFSGWETSVWFCISWCLGEIAAFQEFLYLVGFWFWGLMFDFDFCLFWVGFFVLWF